jgi:MFS family permease
VTIGLLTLLGLADDPGHLTGYGPIPASVARALAADGEWRRLVTDPSSGAPLDYGRRTYPPPAALVDFLIARDGTCRFPGCHPGAARRVIRYTTELDQRSEWRPTLSVVATSAGVRGVLARPHFRRLYATRLTSQAADGIFQASLASAVFFNPERQTNAAQVAAGFAVLLLPYSLVGPFAGVLLDRWRRQRVLVVANVVRAGLVAGVAAILMTVGPASPLFYVGTLAVVGVNRFFLTALSAALPHLVTQGQLVTANSLSTTSGFVASATGGLAGLGIRAIAGAGDRGSATVALVAGAGYLSSSLVAAGFPDRDLLGPDDPPASQRVRAAAATVARGLVAGARHVAQRRPAAYALVAIGAHRFCYGLSTIATLLLYRNYFSDDGWLRAGLAGIGQVVAAGGVGVVLAAVVTPPVTRRTGKPAWIVAVFGAASVVEVVFGLPYTKGAFLVAAVFLGFAAQASKICVDTILQETVDEGFRGRVFAFYDTMFNLTFVSAAVAGAVVLPASGRSYAVLGAIAAGYALIAVAYGLAARSPKTAVRPVRRCSTSS